MRSALVTVSMALGIVLGLSGASFAADAPAFEDVDKNADGKISEQELASVEGVDLATADKNGDGELSRSEYQAATREESGGAGPGMGERSGGSDPGAGSGSGLD